MSMTISRNLDRADTFVFHVPLEKAIVLADDVVIPAGIVDLTTFRQWAHSVDFPERGRIDYSRGTIFVDLSMEKLYDHDQPKGAIFAALYMLTATLGIGRMFEDGVLLSMPTVDRSREPDALFVSFDSFESNRIFECPGNVRGLTELEGIPDMTLEVVSDGSEEKDLVELPEQYYRAGVQEFWRVDARDGACVFEIFRQGSEEYILAHKEEGWQRSTVFGRWFQLRRTADKRGKPLFELLAKE